MSLREHVRRALLRAASMPALRHRFRGWLDPLAGRFLPYRGVGRRRLTLLLDATNRCNLRCVMCHFARPEARLEKRVELTLDDLGRLEREILPRVKHAYLSAGTEPLMWKHFPALLKVFARARVPRFEMITNATLIDAELAARIVESGMTRVQLSVDGATPATYEAIRHGAHFADFLRGLEHLVRARGGARLPELQFNVTLMARNLAELEPLLRLAAAHGVRYLDVRHVVVLPGLGMEAQSLRSEARAANLALERAQRLARELGLEFVRFPAPLPTLALAAAPLASPQPETASIAPALEARPAVTAAAPRALAPLHGPLPSFPRCRAPWEQLFLRPDGRVVPCCFWYTDDALGDIRTQGLDEIWEGPAYRRLRHELLAGELGPNCARCPVLGIGDPGDPRSLEAGAAPGVP